MQLSVNLPTVPKEKADKIWFPGLSTFGLTLRGLRGLALPIFLIFILQLFPQSPFVYSASAQVSKDAIQSLIDDTKSGEMSIEELTNALLSIAQRYPDAGKSLGDFPISLSGFEDAFSREVLPRMSKSLSEGNLDSAQALLDFSLAVLPSESPSRQALIDQFDLARKLEEVGTSGSLDQLVALREVYNSPEARKIIESRSEGLIAAQFKAIEKEKDNFLAFERLAQLDQIAPSAKVISSASKRLNLLGADARANKIVAAQWNLEEKSLSPLLDKLRARGGADAQSYLDLLEWRLIEVVKTGNSDDEVLKRLEEIKTIRADPNPANTALLVRIALAAESPLMKQMSQGFVDELKKNGSLSSEQQSSLASKGYFPSNYNLVLVSVLCVFAVLVVFLVIRPQLLFRASSKYSKHKMNKRGVRYAQVTQEDDEYTRLLGHFSLDDGASEAQIKKAYRAAMKAHHPDMQGASGVATNEAGEVDRSFEELKKSYDRIMEIRGSWFGLGKS
jgi:hypothetical protein